MATYEPGFKICIYCVGLQCKKNGGEVPSGTKVSEFSDIRFCNKIGQAEKCDGSETVGTFPQAEAVRRERGIS